LKVNDKVILVKTSNFYTQEFEGKLGVIKSVAEKTPAPYQVKFIKSPHAPVRWCKEDELKLAEEQV
jgi:hypothetical protein